MQYVDYLKLTCAFILVGLKVSDQGLLWLITKLTTLYTVECMLAPHDQEVKTVSSHDVAIAPLFSICCTVQCYPGLFGVCCTVHCAYFSVYIYHSWILPIWHAIICVDASNDCSPPSQCRQGCLLLLCNACVFNLWNITSCLIVVATTVV